MPKPDKQAKKRKKDKLRREKARRVRAREAEAREADDEQGKAPPPSGRPDFLSEGRGPASKPSGRSAGVGHRTQGK